MKRDMKPITHRDVVEWTAVLRQLAISHALSGEEAPHAVADGLRQFLAVVRPTLEAMRETVNDNVASDFVRDELAGDFATLIGECDKLEEVAKAFNGERV